jgi:hypothetical protein
LAPRILPRLTGEPLVDRRLGEGTVEQVVGDPERTRRPETAWHALATIRKEFL